jgi:hypothetical protein
MTIYLKLILIQQRKHKFFFLLMSHLFSTYHELQFTNLWNSSWGFPSSVFNLESRKPPCLFLLDFTKLQHPDDFFHVGILGDEL